MSIVLANDVSNFLKSAKGSKDWSKFLMCCGVMLGVDKHGKLNTFAGVYRRPDYFSEGMKEEPAYIRIDNYQLAKEMQLQLMRLGCPPGMVFLDPKGSKLMLRYPGLTPGSPMPPEFYTQFNALRALTESTSLSAKLEVIIVEMSNSNIKDDPKAEALMRHVRAARAEAMKLKL